MDRKIINYITVSEGETTVSLDDQVRVMIGDGWQPFGGISFEHHFPYQAMVKYEDKESIAYRQREGIKGPACRSDGGAF